MERSKISYSLLLLFLHLLLNSALVLPGPIAHADSSPQAHGISGFKKRSAVALCSAILTTASVGAVVITKLAHTNPNPGWAARSTFYRNRHMLAIALGKGLGLRLKEEMITEDAMAISYIESNYIPYNESESDLINFGDLEALRRSIVFHKADPSSGVVSGFLMFPRLLARFEVSARTDGKFDLTVRDVPSNKVLLRAQLSMKDSADDTRVAQDAQMRLD